MSARGQILPSIDLCDMSGIPQTASIFADPLVGRNWIALASDAAHQPQMLFDRGDAFEQMVDLLGEAGNIAEGFVEHIETAMDR